MPLLVCPLLGLQRIAGALRQALLVGLVVDAPRVLTLAQEEVDAGVNERLGHRGAVPLALDQDRASMAGLLAELDLATVVVEDEGEASRPQR